MRTVVNDRQTVQFVQLWDVDQPSRLHPPSWLISPSKQVGLHYGKLLPHPRQNLLQIAQLDRLFGVPEKRERNMFTSWCDDLLYTSLC